jgi:TonB family protein
MRSCGPWKPRNTEGSDRHWIHSPLGCTVSGAQNLKAEVLGELLLAEVILPHELIVQSVTENIALLILAAGLKVWAFPLQAHAQFASANSQQVETENQPDVFDNLQPVKQAWPVLPLSAKLAHLQGRVSLSVSIDKDGSVSNIQVLSGGPPFVEPALKAVRQWRYAPSKDVHVTVETIFFTRRREDAAPPALKPLTAVRPVYPPEAKEAGIEGRVTLRATVEKDGSVSNLETLAGDPQFAQAAKEAVRQWRYEPMEKPAVTDVILGFTLVRGDSDNLFMSPMAIYKPDPPYTKKARAAKLQGTVQLQVRVGVDGTVSDVKVVKPLGKGLDESAVQTVMTWKFLPALKDGKPIPFKLITQIVFKMRGS